MSALTFLINQLTILLDRMKLFTILDLKKLVHSVETFTESNGGVDEAEGDTIVISETGLVNYLVDCRSLLVSLIKICHKLERICRHVARKFKIGSDEFLRAELMMKTVLKKLHFSVLEYGFRGMTVFKFEIDVGQVISPKRQVSLFEKSKNIYLSNLAD